jgi:hypothetical protein
MNKGASFVSSHGGLTFYSVLKPEHRRSSLSLLSMDSTFDANLRRSTLEAKQNERVVKGSVL